MPFGKKGRKFKPTLTQQENRIAGGAGTGEKAGAQKLQGSNFPGGLSDAEKKFVSGTSRQDPERVREVIRRTRKANK